MNTLTHTTDGHTVTITGSNPKAKGDLVIPSTIDGLTVTSIGNSVFSGCSGLTSVTIPNNITTIGNGAFYRCTGLTNVTIPNSVTSIGSWSFAYCNGLTNVTIPNSVTVIGENAFSGCTGLTAKNISADPKSVIEVLSQVSNRNVSSW